uniref:Ferritin n=1 Tax=Monochamus alternatus TaxID=192382 RepID=A0A077CZF7_MONAT|nr:ferritin 2 [Monochamus alternatus]
MKAFIVFTTLWAVGIALASESCYRDVESVCTPSNKLSTVTTHCTAKYGAIDQIEPRLQKYVNNHFTRSFEYLLMSTHFANYNKNRPGFEKLFRGLSDDTWEDGIELIQYITKRGGKMNFNVLSDFDERSPDFELYEYYSIAKALDTHKELALEAYTLHKEAAKENSKFHDPEISSYIEHEFMHKHRDIIRKLAGYTTDLNNILNGTDSSLSLYLFDEYLQKQ